MEDDNDDRGKDRDGEAVREARAPGDDDYRVVREGDDGEHQKHHEGAEHPEGRAEAEGVGRAAAVHAGEAIRRPPRRAAAHRPRGVKQQPPRAASRREQPLPDLRSQLPPLGPQDGGRKKN